MTRIKKNHELKSKRHSIKYLAVLSFILLGLTTVLTSCSKDDEPIQNSEPQAILPSLTLLNGQTSTNYGVVGSPSTGSLQYTIKATAPDGFDTLVIEKVVNGSASEYETIDITHPNYVEGSNTFTYNLNYILSEDDVNDVIEFKALLLDINNNADNLSFAKTETKMPMHFEYLAMRTDNPPSAANNFPYYVYADYYELKKETINGMNTSTLDKNVVAVLSWNDGSGLYFSSPNITIETQLTDNLTEKSITKFKEISMTAEEFYELNIYDSFEIMNLFEDASFNSHEEKAEGVNIGKIYSFLTYDGNAGLMYVKDLEIQGNVFFVDVDIFYAR
ncbi:hypothetical protein [Hanstruepera marina]|uniref:hypothetical protein n=1 Tax=Hanstruepera marina TaxID=2873265 RepID=UPI001CA6E0D1|nr:hypothetical protein [Hanstruepera marina]